MPITDLDSKSFDTFVQSKAVVLVDFYADWCMPCRMMEPVLHELSSELDGSVRFSRLNVDYAPEIAARFGVFSIPTMIVFRDGKPVERLVGALPKRQLSEILKVIAQS